MTKTNAIRILDRLGIKYELLDYEVDESDLSAIAVAAKLNQPIDQVFKTLVLRGDTSGIFVCIIPGAEELDMKKAAQFSGNKSAAMIAMKEILELTGYIRGGCSPIAMKKDYPTYIDESCMLWDYILVSAGIRGLQVMIAPHDLIKVTSCQTGDLIMLKNTIQGAGL
jgi:Cys-tRNA(Pro)/Cys-tRNA(Cys) deacylase